MSEPTDTVVKLADAFKSPDRSLKGRKTAKVETKAAGGGGKPPTEEPGLPETLPDNCPVKALGTLDGDYFFLDSLGQCRRKKEGELGRMPILSLFGGWGYLRETWPVWKEVDGTWMRRKEFNHSYLAPVLIKSCTDKGVWDPTNKVRGCGSWVENNGDLVMHCGAHLWRSTPEGAVLRADAGIQGDLLYPRRPPLPEPDMRNLAGVGERILLQLETWNFKRGEFDRLCVLGFVFACILGQAAAWRPMLWVTGGKGTGKSTLQLLIELLLGENASVKPTQTSQAFVYQTIGDSSLPVLLDEFEAKEDNKRVQDVIELMRIAASGGELGRGGSDGVAKKYTLKSCFAAFSILIPPLSPQDRSRMAILDLGKLVQREEDMEFDAAADDDDDLALGSKDRWAKTGCDLRGRALKHWPRYRKTYRAYFQALNKLLRDPRPAAQFGALGAAQDLARYDVLDLENVKQWVDMIGDLGLAETGGYDNEPEGCLKYLLAATTDLVRHGTRETIAYYLREARNNLVKGIQTNDPDDADRVLAKLGIRVDKDRSMTTSGPGGKDAPVCWVFISSTHPALLEIFRNTHWKGRPGSPGAWAQALAGLSGAAEKAKEMKIDGKKHWGRQVMYEAIFPNADEVDSRVVEP